MENYRSFDQLRTSELQVIRHGFFNAWFEITDGQFSYGKIAYRYFSRARARIETADNAWTFRRKQLFSRTVLIFNKDNELIGETTRQFFSQGGKLSMLNGFNAEFVRTSFFPSEFSWISNQQGEILKIHRRLFLFFTGAEITINPSVRLMPEVPLLSFLSIHLSLLRRRRRAAH